MLIERKTAKFLQLLLIDLQALFAAWKEDADLAGFALKARPFHPRAHKAFWSSLLDSEDRALLRTAGRAAMLASPLAEGEMSGGARERLQAFDANFMTIRQYDCRLLWALAADLNNFFNDPANYDSAAKIDRSIQGVERQIAECSDILR